MIRIAPHIADFRLPPEQVPRTRPEELSTAETEALRTRIRHLLKQRDAVLVAHYYTAPELQILAEETGGCISDSLEMARFGHRSKARTLVVCGVRFMGETASILNPEKCVLMPDPKATCSLDIGCPATAFHAFCDAHPEHTVVVYANTSAAVKARADWMVTSGSAVPVIRHLQQRGERILWAPDKHLGRYVQEQTGADMLLWPGACVVHEEFKGRELALLRQQYPDAEVLVHPEAPATVIALANTVASTTGIIQAAQASAARRFIVATDQGLLFRLRQLMPDRCFIEAPTAGHSATCISCGHCPWMAMNGLRRLEQALHGDDTMIQVPEAIRTRALRPIKRLLEFSATKHKHHLCSGDA